MTSAIKKIISCGTPFINPSAGSISNNGMLTLNTSLGYAYPNAYLYCQAGMIYTTLNGVSVPNSAGWYFVQFSSTSQCQIFNNVYIAGKPSIPAYPLPFVGAVAPAGNVFAAMVGSIMQLGTLRLIIPANMIGPNGRLRMERVISMSNTGTNKNFGVVYGGNQFETVSTNIIAQYRDTPVVWNNGDASINSGSYFSGLGVQTIFNGFSRQLVPSTIDQLLVPVVQIPTAAEYAVQEYFSAEIIYGA